MTKMLIAIDGSECSFRAVEYAGRHFSAAKELEVTLLHVLPYPPAPLWDDGHIPTTEEKVDRDRQIEKWLSLQRAKTEPLFDKAIAVLTREGMSRLQISRKTISDSIDVAGSILEEMKDGGYHTLIVGRRGLSPVKKFLMGSVTAKLITHGSGVAITVVE